MKKTVLLSLLLVLILTFGCSSNEDDNESQTFLEKYDGVVWLEDSSNSLNDYASLIQFLQTSKSLVVNEMPNGIDGFSNCDTKPLTYEDSFGFSIITENTEDTFVRNYSYLGGGNNGTVTESFTVTNQGKSLRIRVVYTDTPIPGSTVFYYSRSNLGMNCD